MYDEGVNQLVNQKQKPRLKFLEAAIGNRISKQLEEKNMYTKIKYQQRSPIEEAVSRSLEWSEQPGVLTMNE